MNQKISPQQLAELKQINAEQAAQALPADATAREAAAEPLPGPTADVFAVPASVPVGRWEVRPFYDLDFVMLRQMRHPLSDYMRAAMAGKPLPEDWVPTGPEAWELFWLMTHSVEDGEAAMAADGLGVEAKLDARREFGRLGTAALLKLYEAVVRQLSVCTGAVVGYGPPREEGESDALPNS